MNIDRFWEIIQSTKDRAGDDTDVQSELLITGLTRLPAEEIIAFGRLFYDLHVAAYRAPLWIAAEIINAGASKDGFFYFREWLVLQGRSVYENALHDPETLKDAIVMDPDWIAESEGGLSAALEAYRRKTGQELPPGRYRCPDIASQDLDATRATDPFPGLNEAADARYRR